MLVDLSVLVTRYRSKEALDNEKIAAFGHMGTHFGVMDKEFPLEYVLRDAVVFEVPPDPDREIAPGDIDLSLLGRGVSIIGIDFAGMRRDPGPHGHGPGCRHGRVDIPGTACPDTGPRVSLPGRLVCG